MNNFNILIKENSNKIFENGEILDVQFLISDKIFFSKIEDLYNVEIFLEDFFDIYMNSYRIYEKNSDKISFIIEEKDIEIVKYFFTPYKIFTAKIKTSGGIGRYEEKEPGHYSLLEIIEENSKNEEMQEKADLWKNKINFIDDFFGEINIIGDEAKISFNNYNLTVNCYDDEKLNFTKEKLEILKNILKDIDKKIEELKEIILEEQYDNLEEDEKEKISKNFFKEKIFLDSIFLDEYGINYLFDDNDFFGGHKIFVNFDYEGNFESCWF